MTNLNWSVQKCKLTGCGHIGGNFYRLLDTTHFGGYPSYRSSDKTYSRMGEKDGFKR